MAAPAGPCRAPHRDASHRSHADQRPHDLPPSGLDAHPKEDLRYDRHGDTVACVKNRIGYARRQLARQLAPGSALSAIRTTRKRRSTNDPSIPCAMTSAIAVADPAIRQRPGSDGHGEAGRDEKGAADQNQLSAELAPRHEGGELPSRFGTSESLDACGVRAKTREEKADAKQVRVQQPSRRPRGEVPRRRSDAPLPRRGRRGTGSLELIVCSRRRGSRPVMQASTPDRSSSGTVTTTGAR
jgi:hypothetical protein